MIDLESKWETSYSHSFHFISFTEPNWLTNHSFDPNVAQARAHRHGDDDAYNFKQETNVTVHNLLDNSSYQSLSAKLLQPTVKEEYMVIPDENDPISSANLRSNIVVKTERDERKEVLQRKQSDSDSVSSNEDLRREEKQITSKDCKVKVEDVKREPPNRDKKHRSREDSHRHKTSRKRHHRSDPSPERDNRKHKKKKGKHKEDREKKKQNGDTERSSKEYKR